MNTQKHIPLLILLGILFFPFLGNAQTAASVDLMWQADSYVPPFYAGKALPTATGDITVFAFVPTSFGDASRILYTWSLNGRVLGSLSGVGRSSLKIAGSPFINERSVRVNVTTPTGREGFGYINIPTVKPKVLLYEETPLGGVLFEHALTNRIEAQTDTDVVITASPYFFSTQNQRALSFDWKINGETIDTGATELTARSETAGTSTVHIEVQHPNRILERASKILSVVLQ